MSDSKRLDNVIKQNEGIVNNNSGVTSVIPPEEHLTDK